MAIGPVNGWLSALKWERFWGVKAGGSHPPVALASVTTALRYCTSRYIASRQTSARRSNRSLVQVRWIACPTALDSSDLCAQLSRH